MGAGTDVTAKGRNPVCTASPAVQSGNRAKQWRQLLSLTFAHFLVDMFVGIPAPVLVPMRDRSGLTMGVLIFVSTLLVFAANVLQIPVGGMRLKNAKPHFLALAVALSGLSVIVPNVPRGGAAVALMVIFAALGGLGTAILHPVGLESLHKLDCITPSLSTAVFMVAGFSGFAGGAWLSATLTQHFGLKSLFLLYTLVPFAVAALYAAKVRLPVEGERAVPPPAMADAFPHLPFGPLFAMAALLATSSQIQATLLPSYLHSEVTPGYSLSFSGFSFALYGIGSMLGGVLWGAVAPRLGLLRVLLVLPLVGTVATVAYLGLAPCTAWAAPLLLIAGFTSYSVFPFSITLARFSDSPMRLGTRMGLMSGGSWGIAAAALWVIGPFTEKRYGIGMGPFLHLVWCGYVTAACIALWLARRKQS